MHIILKPCFRPRLLTTAFLRLTPKHHRHAFLPFHSQRSSQQASRSQTTPPSSKLPSGSPGDSCLPLPCTHQTRTISHTTPNQLCQHPTSASQSTPDPHKGRGAPAFARPSQPSLKSYKKNPNPAAKPRVQTPRAREHRKKSLQLSHSAV